MAKCAKHDDTYVDDNQDHDDNSKWSVNEKIRRIVALFKLIENTKRETFTPIRTSDDLAIIYGVSVVIKGPSNFFHKFAKS